MFFPGCSFSNDFPIISFLYFTNHVLLPVSQEHKINPTTTGLCMNDSLLQAGSRLYFIQQEPFGAPSSSPLTSV